MYCSNGLIGLGVIFQEKTKLIVADAQWFLCGMIGSNDMPYYMVHDDNPCQ